MSTRKLFFEEIATTSNVFNKDKIANYPTGHSNASGGYRTVIYQKGDYGQTDGNIFGDTYAGTPACPYHMPRNINRFNDPLLHIERKDANSIIEAKDINNLIDKIKLYSYVWEAEANNIYGYRGVSGRANAPVSIANLKYINATNQSNQTIGQPNHNIYDATHNNKNITIPKEPIFFCAKGYDIQDVRNQLEANKNNCTKTGLSFGSPNTYGTVVTDNNTIPGYNASDASSTNKVINAGNWPTAGTKFVQTGPNTDTYYLQYTSGPHINEYIRDQSGNVITFHTGIPYIESRLESNEPNMDLRYNGFILYWYTPFDVRDAYISETPTTVTVRAQEFTYQKDSYFIGDGKYPTIKGNDYKLVKNVINSYIQSLMVLAQTGKNNGIADADTTTEIGAWNVAQAQQSSVFNKDDPDTSFLGYHAETTGIIKLDFYNVLVDAYKLMINSCICNANCSCNLVCSCNVNCGCNY